MDKEKGHLPLYGVGPVIVFGQFLLTAAAIALTFLRSPGFEVSGIAGWFRIALGAGLIGFGLYLDVSAKYVSGLFRQVEQNRLITDGVYACTRNPVYAGAFLGCCGAVLIAGRPVLLIVPPICWGLMTVMLVRTEEVWLKAQYGEAYEAYRARVNRIIPWFPEKK